MPPLMSDGDKNFGGSLACVAADSFPFLGGTEIEQASEGARLGWAKKLGKSGEGRVRRGRGWGRKESPAINPKYFAERRSLTNGEQ